MDVKEILKHVDHTLLTQTATWAEIRQICDDAVKYGTASVCIPPAYVKQVKEYVQDQMAVCTVIGFPNGYMTTATKEFETKDALANGADEIDMVINIGWAMLIFLAAYLANVAFSLWYNIKILHEPFDRDKLIASGLKILTFVVGLTLLCTSITALPLFATQVGWAIPEEYSDLFADLVIIGSVLLVSCKYIKEAYTKFTTILNTQTPEPEEPTNVIGFAVREENENE